MWVTSALNAADSSLYLSALNQQVCDRLQDPGRGVRSPFPCVLQRTFLGLTIAACMCSFVTQPAFWFGISFVDMSREQHETLVPTSSSGYATRRHTVCIERLDSSVTF